MIVTVLYCMWQICHNVHILINLTLTKLCMKQILSFIVLAMLLSCTSNEQQNRVKELESQVLQLQADNKGNLAKAEGLEKDNKYLREELAKYIPHTENSVMSKLANAVNEANQTFTYAKIAFAIENADVHGNNEVSNLYWYSGITTSTSWSEDEKYRLLDECERMVKSKYSTSMVRILKRETYSFKTYADASKSLEQASH